MTNRTYYLEGSSEGHNNFQYDLVQESCNARRLFFFNPKNNLSEIHISQPTPLDSLSVPLLLYALIGWVFVPV